MAGFHSLAGDCETAIGAPKPPPFCDAAKMAARPLRQPCHATHTWPWESVAATGNTSDPGSFEICTGRPGLPFSTADANTSKFPALFCDQKTHTRPRPSTAIAVRYKSPPGGVMAMGSCQAPLA